MGETPARQLLPDDPLLGLEPPDPGDEDGPLLGELLPDDPPVVELPPEAPEPEPPEPDDPDGEVLEDGDEPADPPDPPDDPLPPVPEVDDPPLPPEAPPLPPTAPVDPPDPPEPLLASAEDDGVLLPLELLDAELPDGLPEAGGWLLVPEPEPVDPAGEPLWPAGGLLGLDVEPP